MQEEEAVLGIIFGYRESVRPAQHLSCQLRVSSRSESLPGFVDIWCLILPLKQVLMPPWMQLTLFCFRDSLSSCSCCLSNGFLIFGRYSCRDAPMAAPGADQSAGSFLSNFFQLSFCVIFFLCRSQSSSHRSHLKRSSDSVCTEKYETLALLSA